MPDAFSSAADLSLEPAQVMPIRARSRTRAILAALNTNGLTRLGVALALTFILAAVIGPIVGPDGLHQGDAILQSPTWAHPFGTDNLGRDILGRTLEGARLSLVVAVFSVFVGFIIAFPTGLIAGYFGGTWVDEILMGLMDVLLAFPLFVLGLFVLGLTGTGGFNVGPLHVPPAGKVTLLIGLAAVPFFARVARSGALSETQEEYVDALRVSGVSRRRIIFLEIAINVLPLVLVQAFLWTAVAIFAEAALSFLGLGVQPPTATLGNILRDANNYLILGAWWYSVFPGLVLVVATVGFNLVGDGLNDRLGPQSR
jgi:ABC-type dipeptide/oligopeptide/nickel transport system permease subunit